MNQKAAIEEAVKTIKRCAILDYLRYLEGGLKTEEVKGATAMELVQASIAAFERQGEAPRNEIQWHAYAMRLMDKHGYAQEARDELMALITGLRGGV